MFFQLSQPCVLSFVQVKTHASFKKKKIIPQQFFLFAVKLKLSVFCICSSSSHIQFFLQKHKTYTTFRPLGWCTVGELWTICFTLFNPRV